MKKALAVACWLVALAMPSPCTPAIQVHLDPPDPARGTIGVRIVLKLRGVPSGGIADTVYFVRAEKVAEEFRAGSVIASNFSKGENVYLLNAEPGRYVAIGGEFISPPMGRSVVVFSKAEILLTEVEVRAKSVAFMGEIKAESSMKDLVLDETQANALNIIMETSTKLGVMDRISGVPFAHPGVIKKVERGEAKDSEFWSSATNNHFKYEPAWKSLVMARPVLPPEGVAAPKPAAKP